MARQDLNEALAQTSFLFGGNAAYIEGLYAQYAKDPNAVDAEWQAFFSVLKDDDQIVTKNAEGASWTRPNWPIAANGELVAALDGNWAPIEAAVGGKVKAKAQAKGVEVSQAEILQATRDSVRALMLTRAYRARGHLHANLAPWSLRRAATTRRCIRLTTASRTPIAIARSSSTTCSASSSAPSARSSPSWS